MSGIKYNSFLDAIPPYQPGRTASDVAKTLGIPEAAVASAVVKLSSNESPFPPPASVQAAIEAASSASNRYPDFHTASIASVLSDRLGVDTSQIVVANGSGSLIRQLCLITSGHSDEVIFASPSYRNYEIGAIAAGSTPVSVPLVNYAHSAKLMVEAISSRTSLAFICNPNNPTGTTITRQDFECFMAAVPDHILVVIDEAYHEFVTTDDSPNGLDYLNTYKNLAVLRTFSKAYGLAGLRIGYCVGGEQIAGLLRKLSSDFSVSSIAQTAGLAALEPEAEKEVSDRVTSIVDERTRVTAELEGSGVQVIHSQANFIFIPIGPRSADLAVEFEKRGIIVKSFGEEGIRVTIGLSSENDKFVSVAKDLLIDVP